MPNEEVEIMRDMFCFLRDHNDPPAVGTAACETYWLNAAKDIGALVGGKWNNHLLAMEVGMAVYNYLEKKCKAKGGGG